jgi:predicted CopG family antitoxin
MDYKKVKTIKYERPTFGEIILLLTLKRQDFEEEKNWG